MEQAPLGIAYKELFPIILDCVLWGSQWQQQRVQFQCDNESVAAVLRTGSSRDANNDATDSTTVFWKQLALTL